MKSFFNLLFSFIFIYFIPCYFHRMQELTKIQQIVILDERQKKTDQQAIKQWKNARRQIRIRMTEAHSEKKHLEKMQLLIENAQYLSAIQPSSLKMMLLNTQKIYGKQITQLFQSYREMEQHYKRKIRQCRPLLDVIQFKCTTLQRIQIEYTSKKDVLGQHQLPYSISAFEVFKVVHSNRLLTELTLIGVQIQKFQQFIALLNPKNHATTTQHDWIKCFSPSKLLKVAINANVQFRIFRKQKAISRKDDLLLIIGCFSEVSHIAAKIVYVQANLGDALQDLFKCLKAIKKLKLCIEYKVIPIQSHLAKIVRAKFFGGLTFFTQIAQLSFINMKFSYGIQRNDYFAMEQIFSTIFQNNVVKRLYLCSCMNFPVIPLINTLQSIYVDSVSFRKEFSLMNRVAQNCPSVKSIEYLSTDKQWEINDQIFNQLQTLASQNFQDCRIDNISPYSPSNMRHLKIGYSSNIPRTILPVIFPKLLNLATLYISNINFDDNALCRIPSKHLYHLGIFSNNQLTDKGIKEIDFKWPFLKIFRLSHCQKVTYNAWQICRFEGLIALETNIQWTNSCLQTFKLRGIKVSAASFDKIN